MKKRNLMFALLIAVFIMIISLICIFKLPNLSDTEKPLVQNAADVINQGADILEYNGSTFMVDENKIYRYDKFTDTVRNVGNIPFKKVYNKLFIVRDKLLFSADEQIYIYDISNGGINQIFEGQLEYADNNVYIYTVFENSKEYLYISSYNEKNMQIINDYIYCLAHGLDIFFLREQGNILLFGSNNGNGTKSLFSVDLEKEKCEVLIKSCNSHYSQANKLVDAAILNEGEYYYILTNIESNSLGESEVESYLYYYMDSYGDSEMAISDITPGLLKHKKDKDAILVRYFDGIENLYKWGSITSDLEEYTVYEIQGDVTDSFVKAGTDVICEGEKIGKIKEDNWITYAVSVGDTFYIKVNDLQSSYWYTYSKDGTFRKII